MITHPRTITVYECSGFDEAENHVRQNYKCVPTQTTNILKAVYRYDFDELETKTFVNHTKCGMKCVCELDGYKCSTKDKFIDEVPCPVGSK